jgi:glycosyltransferase involved in cell wall biosynthesis
VFETAWTHCKTAPRLALSIVIPVFNGARSVAELIGALEELPIPGGHEIVLVNDGSADDSLEVLRALCAKARVPMTLIDLARNYGEHNAVIAGLRHAGGAHVITMDDDLQNPPEEVQRLLSFAQHSGIHCGATSAAVLRTELRISSSTSLAACIFPASVA